MHDIFKYRTFEKSSNPTAATDRKMLKVLRKAKTRGKNRLSSNSIIRYSEDTQVEKR